MRRWIELRNRNNILSFLMRIFGRRRVRIGIYGPPNAGKTTLANRIIQTFVDGGDHFGSVTEIPHETRRAVRREGIVIKANIGKKRRKEAMLRLDIVDTPGLATKIDFHDFIRYGLKEEEAKRRAKEATQGVIEAIKWLDDVDGVVLVFDATENPYTQTNIVIVGNMEARGIPIVIAANKMDLPNASPQRIKNAFPQHIVVPISALNGDNMDALYEEMVRKFR